MDYLTLDVEGVILAFVMAFVMLFVATFSEPNIVQGWVLGIYYIIVMLFFLALSAIVTRAGRPYKMSIHQYQKTRSVKNVLANGLGPLLFVIVVLFGGTVLITGFIGSVAAVAADKFSSEIGVLDGTPSSIVSFKKVKKGVSGGITMVGLGAGLLAAILIAVFAGLAFASLLPPAYNAYSCPSNGCNFAWWQYNLSAFAIITGAIVGGFIGTIVDSYLGYFEEKGFGNKYTSNFVCSVVGGLVGIAIYALIMGTVL